MVHSVAKDGLQAVAIRKVCFHRVSIKLVDEHRMEACRFQAEREATASGEEIYEKALATHFPQASIAERCIGVPWIEVYNARGLTGRATLRLSCGGPEDAARTGDQRREQERSSRNPGTVPRPPHGP